MSREDIEEHIEQVADGEKDPEPMPFTCDYCGAELDEDYITWVLDATPVADVAGWHHHFCNVDCFDAYKQEILADVQSKFNE